MSARTLRVSDETHARAVRLAAQHGMTLTGLVKVALDRFEDLEVVLAAMKSEALERVAEEAGTPAATSAVDLMPLEEMRLLDFVQWDRFVEGEREVVVYGWIERTTLRDDFVVLTSVPAGVGFLTSSAKYSEEIGRRLNGGEPSGTHSKCQRVEVVSDLPNVIRLASSGPETCPVCRAQELLANLGTQQ